MKRVGMLTSGGDCQSLNATMRGVAKALYEKDDETDLSDQRTLLYFGDRDHAADPETLRTFCGNAETGGNSGNDS